MPKFDSSATARRMTAALRRFGYQARSIEHGLALEIQTVGGSVVLWLPEAHPAREYLWQFGGVDRKVPAYYGWDSEVVAGSVARSIPEPVGGRLDPPRNHNSRAGVPASRLTTCDLACSLPYHDHAAYDDQGRRIRGAVLLCRRCGETAHYDTTIDAYQHDDSTLACRDSRWMAVSTKRSA